MEKPRNIARRDFFRTIAAATAATAAAVPPDVQAAASSATFAETKRIPLSIDSPSALAVGPANQLYVAGENVAVVLDGEGKEAVRLSVNGHAGCLAAGPDGKLLFGMRNHVQVLDVKGALLASWQDLGERAHLTSIAIDEQNVYVADAGNRVVLRFGHDGTLQGRIGEKDKARGIPGLIVPSAYFDVAIDPQGAVWVVNPGKHGLENYRPNGDLVSSWYRSGMEEKAFCGCCNPIHIAFRSDNSLVTAEKGICRVKVYAPETSLLGIVTAEPPPPIEDNKALFCNIEPPIMDLAVDGNDRILVLNKAEKAILVYEEKRSSASKAQEGKPA